MELKPIAEWTATRYGTVHTPSPVAATGRCHRPHTADPKRAVARSVSGEDTVEIRIDGPTGEEFFQHEHRGPVGRHGRQTRPDRADRCHQVVADEGRVAASDPAASKPDARAAAIAPDRTVCGG